MIDATASLPLQPTYVAIGVISAPEYTKRRLGLRASWMRWPNVGSSRAVAVRFVVRTGEAPPLLQAALEHEERLYPDDILRIAVRWNESRLRGPVLSVAAWLKHATVMYRGARFIAKGETRARACWPRIASKAFDPDLLVGISRAASRPRLSAASLPESVTVVVPS